MRRIRTIKDIVVEMKKVIVRVDFNVPVDEKGNVMEDDRIRAAVPTIMYLIGKGCRIILMSHLGRPEGKVVEGLRMGGVAKRLSGLLGVNVKKLDDCIGDAVTAEVENMKSCDVVLLENLRFHAGEESNDKGFAKQLASLAEVYVNDAFAASHRAHASVVAITKFLPSCAGLLLEKEINTLGGLLEKPSRPFIVFLGGAKVPDKISLIGNLVKKADKVIVAGAMAFTFLKAKGFRTGKSKVDADFVGEAKGLLEKGNILLPVDFIISDKFDANSNKNTVSAENIKDGWIGLDIGPETLKIFKKEVEKARTILWNGPAGVFEFERFCEGTEELAKMISRSKAVTVIGGGDTIAAVKKFGLEGKFSYASTGGGAMIEFLEGKKLPAIAALEKASSSA